MAELLDSLGIKDRTGVELFIERLIELLDDIDGDPDFEPEETDQNGDEGDYLSNEDDCPEHLWGVPVASLPGQGL